MKSITRFGRHLKLRVAYALGDFSGEEILIYYALESAANNSHFKDDEFHKNIDRAEKLLEDYHGNRHQDFELYLDDLIN